MIQERTGIVTFQGSPLTLLGPELTVGAQAPSFALVDNDLQPVSLADTEGKLRLITVVPSLDTPVCDAMTRRFNQEAARLSDDVVIYAVSVDLPFAQKRWCGNAGIDRIKTLSDYQERAFGLAYGLLVKEIKLLARAVLVIDRQGRIAYRQIVGEIVDEPDYQAALEAVRKLL
jgi:thiol peroxidase